MAGKKCPGWCGSCYTNAKGKTNIKGHWRFRKVRKPYVLKPWERKEMKRPEEQAGADAQGAAPPRGDLFAMNPLVYEMLTASKYDDGTRRKRSTVLLVADGGTAKICIVDGDANRQAWVTGDTWEQAIATLEEQLELNRVNWTERRDDFRAGRRK